MENAAKKGLWGDVAPIVTCYCQLIIGSKRLVLNVETFVSFGQFRTKPLSAKSRELVFQHVTVCAPSSWPSVCPIASISTIQIFVATSLYFTFFPSSGQYNLKSSLLKKHENFQNLEFISDWQVKNTNHLELRLPQSRLIARFEEYFSEVFLRLKSN